MKNKKGADKCQLESKSKQNRNNKSTTLVRVTTQAGERWGQIALRERLTQSNYTKTSTLKRYTYRTQKKYSQIHTSDFPVLNIFSLLDFLKYLILNSELNVTWSVVIGRSSVASNFAASRAPTRYLYWISTPIPGIGRRARLCALGRKWNNSIRSKRSFMCYKIRLNLEW